MLPVGVDGVVVVVLCVAVVPLVMVPVAGSTRGGGWSSPRFGEGGGLPAVPVFDVMHVRFHSYEGSMGAGVERL
jgi:hypothetical protein